MSWFHSWAMDDGAWEAFPDQDAGCQFSHAKDLRTVPPLSWEACGPACEWADLVPDGSPLSAAGTSVTTYRTAAGPPRTLIQTHYSDSSILPRPTIGVLRDLDGETLAALRTVSDGDPKSACGNNGAMFHSSAVMTGVSRTKGNPIYWRGRLGPNLGALHFGGGPAAAPGVIVYLESSGALAFRSSSGYFVTSDPLENVTTQVFTASTETSVHGSGWDTTVFDERIPGATPTWRLWEHRFGDSQAKLLADPLDSEGGRPSWMTVTEGRVCGSLLSGCASPPFCDWSDDFLSATVWCAKRGEPFTRQDFHPQLPSVVQAGGAVAWGDAVAIQMSGMNAPLQIRRPFFLLLNPKTGESGGLALPAGTVGDGASMGMSQEYFYLALATKSDTSGKARKLARFSLSSVWATLVPATTLVAD